METALLFIIGLSVTIELLTLRDQMHLVYCDKEKVNTVMIKNWKLISLYGLIALMVFPITVVSVIWGRDWWEEKLYNSIKNNLYIKEVI